MQIFIARTILKCKYKKVALFGGRAHIQTNCASFLNVCSCSTSDLYCLCSLPCRTQATDLALLIAQMQKDADLVEKDVLRAEELLAVVRNNKEAHSDATYRLGSDLIIPKITFTRCANMSPYLLSAFTRIMKMTRKSCHSSIRRRSQTGWVKLRACWRSSS